MILTQTSAIHDQLVKKKTLLVMSATFRFIQPFQTLSMVMLTQTLTKVIYSAIAKKNFMLDQDKIEITMTNEHGNGND